MPLRARSRRKTTREGNEQQDDALEAMGDLRQSLGVVREAKERMAAAEVQSAAHMANLALATPLIILLLACASLLCFYPELLRKEESERPAYAIAEKLSPVKDILEAHPRLHIISAAISGGLSSTNHRILLTTTHQLLSLCPDCDVSQRGHVLSRIPEGCQMAEQAMSDVCEAGRVFVLRIAGDAGVGRATSVYGRAHLLDRTMETALAGAAYDIGIAPELLLHKELAGFLLTRFVCSSATLTPSMMVTRMPEILPLVHRLHTQVSWASVKERLERRSFREFLVPYAPLLRAKARLAYVEEELKAYKKIGRLLPRHEELLAPVVAPDDLEEVWAEHGRERLRLPAFVEELFADMEDVDGLVGALSRPEDWVGLHCDLTPLNVLTTNERLWLVDYEYGGVGDPAYDVANYALMNDLNEEDEQLLLTSYAALDAKFAEEMEADSDFVWARHETMKQLTALQEGMWGLTQHFASTIAIEPDADWPPQSSFWEYGIHYLQGVFDATQSHRFRRFVALLRDRGSAATAVAG